MVECVSDPEVPVTVSVYVPAGVPVCVLVWLPPPPPQAFMHKARKSPHATRARKYGLERVRRRSHPAANPQSRGRNATEKASRRRPVVTPQRKAMELAVVVTFTWSVVLLVPFRVTEPLASAHVVVAGAPVHASVTA